MIKLLVATTNKGKLKKFYFDSDFTLEERAIFYHRFKAVQRLLNVLKEKLTN